jgi:predicted house-cleaning noncanonical NTP pyrophosphatase (MazG superfamily)
MARVLYNKLVRDGIKSKIESKGETCEVRELTDDAEFIAALRKKIIEEATELSVTEKRTDFVTEYADLMIALDALTAQLEISPAEIQVALEENIKRKGKFSKRHFLLWSQTND